MTDFSALAFKAQRHLARRDSVMKTLIKQVGRCTLQHNPDHFHVLARSIISQRISSKAALSIGARLLTVLGSKGLVPAAIVRTPEDKLRGAGLSAAKTRYLLDLATKVHSKELRLQTLHELTDEDVIEQLIIVKGIGRWTAQMFLIFSLGRTDVLPVDDLGLRAGVRRHYGLVELPKRQELEALAEPWRPYRTFATWYCWRSLGGVPQSEA